MKKIRQVSLSIIIVYFGDFKALNNLIVSIKKNRIENIFEIIVVNNKLDDNIKHKLKRDFKDVKYIKSSGNIGYGAGNNLGVKQAKGNYLLIVNPDTRIFKGSIDGLVNFLDSHKKAAIIAPNLVDTNGNLFEKQGTITLTPLRAIFSLSILSKIFRNNKLFRDYYMLDVPKNNFREVDVVPGTAFMIRKTVFDKLRGFDENFFLYFEEMDLCKRVKDSGYKIYMTPALILEHDWSSDEGTEALKRVFSQSRFYYFKKHYGLIYALLVEFFARLSRRKLSVFILILSLLVLVFLL